VVQHHPATHRPIIAPRRPPARPPWVDAMLRQSGTYRSNENRHRARHGLQRASKRKRGITITWPRNNGDPLQRLQDQTSSILPGHARLRRARSSEPSRWSEWRDAAWSMPPKGRCPQTRYVPIQRAPRSQAAPPILVINKIDPPRRPPSRREVLNEVYDLF